jgi:mannose-6-phosphate isomerase-like protein (cupin superfamily)
MEKKNEAANKVIELGAGEGRCYEMGKLTALFKADEEDTRAAYCISEWRIEPGFDGVGAHSHEANDEVFIVLEGTPDILVGNGWRTYQVETFVRIPRGMTHDFRNMSGRPARLLNIFIPGGFERDMPKIVEWFAQN